MKLIRLTILITALSFSFSYFAVKYISEKIQHETMQVQYLSSSIEFLKDLHTICMLDYTINPNGREILNECKKIEEKIEVSSKYMEDSLPFYNLYRNIFN